MKQIKQWAMAALLTLTTLASHAAGAPAPAGTWVAYTYTGNNLTNRVGYTPSKYELPGVSVNETINDRGIGIDLLIPTYLEPGQTTRYRYAGTPYNNRAFDIELSTDDSGNIIAWDVSTGAGEGSYWEVGTRSGPAAKDFDSYFSSMSYSSNYRWNAGTPGSWSRALVSSDAAWTYIYGSRVDTLTGRLFAVVVLPEPETYALTLIGLLMVGGMAKRQARRTGQRSAR